MSPFFYSKKHNIKNKSQNIIGDKMQISWIKSSKDNKSFKVFKAFRDGCF